MKKILLVLFLGILSYSVQSQVLTYVQNGDTLVMGIEQIHHIASLTGRKSGIYRSTKNTRRVDTDQYYSEIEDQIGNYLLQFTNFNGDTIALNKIYIGSIVESSSGKAIIFSSILNTQFNTMETFDTIYARAQTVPWTASGATGPGGLFEASNDTETMAVDTAYVKPSVGLTIIHNQSGSIRNYTSFKNLKFETASAFGSANSLFKVEGGSLFGYGGSTSDGFTGTFGRLFVNNFGYDARFFNTSAGDEGQMILDFNGSKFRFDDGTTDRFINITTSGISINGNYTWPDADGSANQVLSTNGSGVLGFTDALNGVYSAGNDASEAAIDSLMINSSEDFGIYAQGTYPNYFKMAGATGIDYGVTGLFGIAHRFRMTQSITRWESTNTGSNQQSIIEVTPTTITFLGESTSSSLDSRMVITGNGADIRMQHTDASNTNTYQVEVDDTGVNINENYYFANDDGNAGELVSTDGAGQYGYTAANTYVYRASDTTQNVQSDLVVGFINPGDTVTITSINTRQWLGDSLPVLQGLSSSATTGDLIRVSSSSIDWLPNGLYPIIQGTGSNATLDYKLDGKGFTNISWSNQAVFEYIATNKDVYTDTLLRTNLPYLTITGNIAVNLGGGANTIWATNDSLVIAGSVDANLPDGTYKILGNSGSTTARLDLAAVGTPSGTASGATASLREYGLSTPTDGPLDLFSNLTVQGEAVFNGPVRLESSTVAPTSNSYKRLLMDPDTRIVYYDDQPSDPDLSPYLLKDSDTEQNITSDLAIGTNYDWSNTGFRIRGKSGAPYYQYMFLDNLTTTQDPVGTIQVGDLVTIDFTATYTDGTYEVLEINGGGTEIVIDYSGVSEFTFTVQGAATATVGTEERFNITQSGNITTDTANANVVVATDVQAATATFSGDVNINGDIKTDGLNTDSAPTKLVTYDETQDRFESVDFSTFTVPSDITDTLTAINPIVSVAYNATRDSVVYTHYDGTTTILRDSTGGAGGGTPTESPVYLNRDSVTWIQDEFSSGTLLSTNQNGTMGNIGWDQTVSGTVTTSSPYVSGHPGVLQLLQTTSNAYEFIDLPQTKIRLDKDFQLVVVARVNDVTISTHGTQWGYFQLGLVEDAAWNINPSNGLFFRVNGTSGTTFLAQTSNGGTRTEASTGINCQANAWHEFRIEWDASSSTAKFYIDGALTNTSTTNLPTGTTLTPRLGSSNGIVSSITTTSQWDYFYLRTQL